MSPLNVINGTHDQPHVSEGANSNSFYTVSNFSNGMTRNVNRIFIHISYVKCSIHVSIMRPNEHTLEDPITIPWTIVYIRGCIVAMQVPHIDICSIAFKLFLHLIP